MKRRKKSSISEAQKIWIDLLNTAGTPAVICYGAEEAINFVKKFDKFIENYKKSA